MRVFILALAILLLPLRGWLGDGMSTAMAIDAAHAMPTDAHAMHDTVEPSHGAHGGHDDAGPGAHGCQSTCSDCQLCHSLAMAFWPEPAAVVDAPCAAPGSAPAAFASAEPARGFKPPIS